MASGRSKITRGPSAQILECWVFFHRMIVDFFVDFFSCIFIPCDLEFSMKFSEILIFQYIDCPTGTTRIPSFRRVRRRLPEVLPRKRKGTLDQNRGPFFHLESMGEVSNA